LLWRSPGDAEENGWKREEWYKVIRAMRLADGFDMFSAWGLKREAANLLVVLERQHMAWHAEETRSPRKNTREFRYYEKVEGSAIGNWDAIKQRKIMHKTMQQILILLLRIQKWQQANFLLLFLLKTSPSFASIIDPKTRLRSRLNGAALDQRIP
jgi:hypothetical protein